MRTVTYLTLILVGDMINFANLPNNNWNFDNNLSPASNTGNTIITIIGWWFSDEHASETTDRFDVWTFTGLKIHVFCYYQGHWMKKSREKPIFTPFITSCFKCIWPANTSRLFFLTYFTLGLIFCGPCMT